MLWTPWKLASACLHFRKILSCEYSSARQRRTLVEYMGSQALTADDSSIINPPFPYGAISPLKSLVIDAGIAGLSAAVGLRRAGHDVEVLQAFHSRSFRRFSLSRCYRSSSSSPLQIRLELLSILTWIPPGFLLNWRVNAWN